MSDTAPLFSKIAGNDGCADVIFVHGLMGSPLETWRSSGSTEPEGDYWPTWLAADLVHLNLFAIGYPASLFAKWAKKEMDLFERAKTCLEIMSAYDIGTRPIVFVGHSLGGLLVKQMLRTARESTEEGWRRIADQCKGVFFLATPHLGSSLASLLGMFTPSFSSPHIEKLQDGNGDLHELNESFRSFCASQKMEIVVYYEKFKTKSLLVVDRISSDPGIGGVTPIPVDADHTTICSPDSRSAFVYVSIRKRLNDTLPNTSLEQIIPDDGDDLSIVSDSDRRDLHTKMVSANREHEYTFANSSQNKFARIFEKTGLVGANKLYKQILLDVEQRFQTLVYHPLICNGSSPAEVSLAVQNHVIEPLAQKYSSEKATPTTIMNALYFLTERCHVRWDKP